MPHRYDDRWQYKQDSNWLYKQSDSQVSGHGKHVDRLKKNVSGKIGKAFDRFAPYDRSKTSFIPDPPKAIRGYFHETDPIFGHLSATPHEKLPICALYKMIDNLKDGDSKKKRGLRTYCIQRLRCQLWCMEGVSTGYETFTIEQLHTEWLGQNKSMLICEARDKIRLICTELRNRLVELEKNFDNPVLKPAPIQTQPVQSDWHDTHKAPPEIPTTEALVRIAKAYQVRIPFGKHKGKLLKDVDSDYMKWCIENISDRFQWVLDAMKTITGHKKPGNV